MATKAAARKPPSSGYLFKPFNEDTLAATRDAWTQDATSGEGFVPEVEQAMAWVAAHLQLTDNEMAYGVFNERDKVAVGICETAITKPSARGKWVKLIRLRLRPKIDGGLYVNDPDAVQVALNAYVASVLGVYHVKNQHAATIIKIYGRTQDQMRFLTHLSTKLTERPDVTFQSKIEGRWLVLNWGKK